MKQLTIYCSEELNERITQILHHYELEGFIHMPGIYGNKFKPKGSFTSDLSWQACAFIVFPNESQLQGLVNELREFADKCGESPCMRLVRISHRNKKR